MLTCRPTFNKLAAFTAALGLGSAVGHGVGTAATFFCALVAMPPLVAVPLTLIAAGVASAVMASNTYESSITYIDRTVRHTSKAPRP